MARLTNNVFVGYTTTDEAQKKALMLTYGGEDLNDIFNTLSADKITPVSNTDETQFTKTVRALSDYFNPRQNVEFQRYQFRHTNQEQYETIEKYYTRLMQIAAMCNFADTNAELKSQLIAGCSDDKTTRKGLSEPDVTLDTLLQFAKTLELTDKQHKTVRQTAPINKICGDPPKRKQQVCRQQQKHTSRPCFNCGGSWPHPGGQQQCPARGVTCKRCHKLNHFAKWCKSNRNTRPRPVPRPPQRREQRVNQLDSHGDSDYAYVVNAINSNVVLPHARVKVENVELDMLIDTGASVNVVDEATFARFRPNPRLTRTKTKLVGYMGPAGTFPI